MSEETKPRVVLIVSEYGVETIRPIALSDSETGPALALLDRIAPAIEMLRVLLRDDQDTVSIAV